jgi:hypothetical protein
MSITTLYLLDSTTVGTPSGNYDGSTQDFDGDGVKAVGYYRGQGALQTVTISITGFQGTITLEGSLNESWQDAVWSEAYVYDSASSEITDYHPVNITGAFTWMRVRVTGFDAGTINSVTITY